jgi:hypothetical protein
MVFLRRRQPNLDSPLQFLQPSGDFPGVGAAVEGADADMALALRAETAAGLDDGVRPAKNFVECLPVRGAFGRAAPFKTSRKSSPVTASFLHTFKD